MIRLYNKNDVDSILEIYQPYLMDTNITFEETLPTTTEMTERIDGIAKKFPFLVYIEGIPSGVAFGVADRLGSHVMGYCYATEYKPRAAYRWTVEVAFWVTFSMLA
jgi:phosphinothricin acetyltransferase